MRGPGEPAHHRLPVAIPSRRRRRRRRRLGVTSVMLVTATVLAVTYCLGGSTSPRHGSSRRAPGRHGAHAAHGARRVPPTTAPPPTTTTTTSPGTLPQTDTLPTATSPQFHAAMADLWRGVVTGNANVALPAFFPVGAYRQLKAITNPQQDWQDRLVATFSLDVAAAHDLLGAGAGTAQLVGVNVAGQYAHWVTPGVCYNTIGYYEVPNARVVYREGGSVRSFGIASMISWRGQWYVVHLGAVLRTTPRQGLVDDPATGPGTSAYSSTC
jgi:hypothetical protein